MRAVAQGAGAGWGKGSRLVAAALAATTAASSLGLALSLQHLPSLQLPQVIKQPDDALLALLLGNAIGVMFLLSVAEMWVHK